MSPHLREWQKLSLLNMYIAVCVHEKEQWKINNTETMSLLMYLWVWLDTHLQIFRCIYTSSADMLYVCFGLLNSDLHCVILFSKPWHKRQVENAMKMHKKMGWNALQHISIHFRMFSNTLFKIISISLGISSTDSNARTRLHAQQGGIQVLP